MRIATVTHISTALLLSIALTLGVVLVQGIHRLNEPCARWPNPWTRC